MTSSRNFSLLLLICIPLIAAGQARDRKYDSLPTSWQTGLPLGNGNLGAMVWSMQGQLRFSVDRNDLWDLRPISEFDMDEYQYSWVYQRLLQKGEYPAVQQLFEQPFFRDPAPTRLPAGAIMFSPCDFSEPVSIVHSLDSALLRISWGSGEMMESFIHPRLPVGFIRIKGLKQEIAPVLDPHLFLLPRTGFSSDTVPDGLERLAYPLSVMRRGYNSVYLHQDTYGGASFEIYIEWKYKDGNLLAVWTIRSKYPGEYQQSTAWDEVSALLKEGWETHLSSHASWWKHYWDQSTVKLPDTLLQKQYDAGVYLLGSTSRPGAPAAAFQGVWTNDDGRLPHGKNAYRNDMNTQMNYWAAYSANRLEEASVLTDWLWNYKAVAEKWTMRYFGAAGLNYPGTCAMNAYPLGGYAPYAFSKTISAWMSQHFYWQWKFSMDKAFLQHRAYPWVSQAAEFLENMSVFLPDSSRYLLLSASPEINGNTPAAWFRKNTNYDLALARFLFAAAAEMAAALDLRQDQSRWLKTLERWPELAVDSTFTRLSIAPGLQPAESHPRFSHLVAVYPLALIDPLQGEKTKRLIQESLREIDRLGTAAWKGYSYPWYALLQARAGNGNRAAWALDTFARHYCFPNALHANVAQPEGTSLAPGSEFTIEGNLGFNAAIQEMMLQGQNGLIRVFPAVPEPWKEVSFLNLRTEGAFLVSAVRAKGKTLAVMIFAEKGGLLRLLNPFPGSKIRVRGVDKYDIVEDVISIQASPGQVIRVEESR